MDHTIGDTTLGRLSLAAVGGIITFVLVSWLTGGMFNFIEAALAAVIIARR